MNVVHKSSISSDFVSFFAAVDDVIGSAIEDIVGKFELHVCSAVQHVHCVWYACSAVQHVHSVWYVMYVVEYDILR